ncbi:HIT family protein [bacterium]|nr:MAG: HIT family protein [bacterium]
MKKEDCIFCQISSNSIPSFKIWEDEEFLAILDIFPNTKGMTLVLPKDHYDSYLFEMPADVYNRFLKAARSVGIKLDEKLGSQRTALVAEGMGVNHAHIKLYPLHGLDRDFKAIIPEGEHFYEKYQGYLTTLLGPRASNDDLKKLQDMFL